MTGGRLLGNTYRFQWVPTGTRMLLGIFPLHRIKVGHGGMIKAPYVLGERCDRCAIIVLEEEKKDNK